MHILPKMAIADSHNRSVYIEFSLRLLFKRLPEMSRFLNYLTNYSTIKFVVRSENMP